MLQYSDQPNVEVMVLPESSSADTRFRRPGIGPLLGRSKQSWRAATALRRILSRKTEAEDTLRALGSGEVDAFVVAERGSERRVFTLCTADRPYRMFVENMREGAATVSENGLILYANNRLVELLGRPREQVVGSMLAQFVQGDPMALEHLIGHQNAGATVEFDLMDKDRRHIPVRAGVSPLELDGRRLSCVTFADLSAQRNQEMEIELLRQGQAERLSDLQNAQAKLTHQATHDALTGLPNRTLLLDRIGQALVRAGRLRGCAAVFFIDLDGFKQVNDNYGHAEGDDVLRAVAQRLMSVLRSCDTVARIGGDEFVVLAQDVEDEMHAVDIGARLIRAIRGQPGPTGSPEPVTASVGIAVSSLGRGTAEDLLNEADIAMYLAKSSGGDHAEIFDAALGRMAHQRSASRKLLQDALDDRRVVAFYQPIIDISTDRIAGFEALARILDSDGGLVPPSEFIPLAEDSGMIVPLGTEILALACREATGWDQNRTDGRPLAVAVNLSSRQFDSGNLPALVEKHLESTGMRPELLHLELTETATLDLRRSVLVQLAALRDLGVEIGLDDFGTGYGSLTHLRRLPLTFVKIDQTFVGGLGTVPEDERIVAAVVNLAQNLGLRCIAEGVETTTQLDFLRRLGCDQAQGYLIAKPGPAASLEDSFLKSTQWGRPSWARPTAPSRELG